MHRAIKQVTNEVATDSGMEELSIKVTIAGRTYPLTIKRDEEEDIRKASNMINKNVEDLQENYAVKDNQDLIAMTALQYATEVIKSKSNTIDDDGLAEELVGMNEKLTGYLSTV